jgi:hypothetical protein
MAADWIKFEHTTPDKPEVVRIAALLRMDRDAVVGRLLRIWIWADQNSIDGADVPITAAFIDELTRKRGFAAAMRTAGWLEGDDCALGFPGFYRHNGCSAKARAGSARRMANSRATRNESATNVTPYPQQKAQPEKRERREEKRGGGEEAPPPPDSLVPLSDPFNHLAELKRCYPEIKIEAELAAALRHKRKTDPTVQTVDLAWFAEHWLPKCGPSYAPGGPPPGQPTLAAMPEPEGWRETLEEAHPGNLINRDQKPWTAVPNETRQQLWPLLRPDGATHGKLLPDRKTA